MALLEQIDLEKFADTITVDLPYGRKRALEIATTLAMDPELMLLDEPTQGMGHEDMHRVIELIKKVSEGSYEEVSNNPQTALEAVKLRFLKGTATFLCCCGFGIADV